MGSQGLDEMVIKPAYESCAKATEDCLEPRCCASSGYSCFKTSSGKGKCMPRAGLRLLPYSPEVVSDGWIDHCHRERAEQGGCATPVHSFRFQWCNYWIGL